jgi:hypothetical protein
MARRLSVKTRGPVYGPFGQFSNLGGTYDFEGDFEFEVEDLDKYVQVKFPGTSYPYTYRDPSGKLEVGDIVKVPRVNHYAAGFSNLDGIAEVVALGRGHWDGEVKDITTRLRREELV